MSGARRLGASLRGRIGVCAILAIFVILSDQVTKAWALDSLHNGRQIPLLGDFITLQLVHNPGAAFSLGASTTWFFTLLAFVILAFLAYGLWRMNSASSAGAIGLLMGGAIGNLIDRLSQPPSFGQGHVIDFINYTDFFVGNIADIWIVIGAAWLAWELMRSLPEEEQNPVSAAPLSGLESEAEPRDDADDADDAPAPQTQVPTDVLEAEVTAHE